MKHLIFKGITPYLFAFIALFSLQTVCGEVSIAKTSTVETALCSQCGDDGDADAQLQLGICYYYAMGVEKDINMALYLYELSADNGNMEAQYRLARCYRYGIAGRHDVNKAIKLYAKAAAQGHAKAAKELDEWNY